MRAMVIVVYPPLFELITGVFDRTEQLDIQAFIPESSVEALDEAILQRLAGAV